MSGAAPAKPVPQWRQQLRVEKLRALPAREVLMLASRFARHEAGFAAEHGAHYKPFKVGVLASLSSQHLVGVLRLFLYAEGLAPRFHEGGYDSIAAEGLDDQAPIWAFGPDALVVLPDAADIRDWPAPFAAQAEVEQWAAQKAGLYLEVWRAAARRNPQCRVYHGLFVPPLGRPLGNLERSLPFSRTRCLERLNDLLVANCPANVTLVDLGYLASLAGRQSWFDEAAYFTSKQPLSLRELPTACAYIARLIGSGAGLVRKCLALDLDNTLWGGVIGDDGVAGIRVDPGDPVGEAYLAFQQYVLALKERGVVLAVCSKNDEAIARAAFQDHPGMALKLDDFAVFKANWDDKVTNLRRIADELNIGLDSLVFFDDNPAERAIVSEFEPAVLVVDVPPDPAAYVRALESSFAFEWPQLTAEDLGRAESYAQERRRGDLLQQFTDYDAYLRSLQMRAWIEPSGPDALARVAQLMNKTNQFNLRTQRYAEESLSALAADAGHLLMHVRFADRFSDYGIVAAVLLRFEAGVAFIDNWVMSCRTFKRGLEDATFNAIARVARERGATHLAAEFVATKKNGYVDGMLQRLGLLEWQADVPAWVPREGQLYRADLRSLAERSHLIAV